MGIDNHLEKIYPQTELTTQKQRYLHLIEKFKYHFKYNPQMCASVPGRTEIGGNHTDHNHGNVLAGAINLDSIAAASQTGGSIITLYSEGYAEPFKVDLNQLAPISSEYETSQALIRGIAFKFKKLGYDIGGFDAVMASQVFIGSGLSSSASVEVLIGTILNQLYNAGSIRLETLALICQYAENVYFNKPCGLMDQIACAAGGLISIDFLDPIKPVVRKVNFNLKDVGYKLIVVNTGSSHSDLTDEYTAVPGEMKQVAEYFNQEVCRYLYMSDIIGEAPYLREKLSDRSILRAMHFIEDSDRVRQQVTALESGEFQQFLDLVNDSGDSSFKWLQNIYSTKDPGEQGVSLALALTGHFMRDIKKPAAWRVHGGGFAGTIQVFLADEDVQTYCTFINNIFGEYAALVLSIREVGACVFYLR
jgi:galactokinase